MGKLTKAKIDEITRLRQQGYTQREVAEKAKVHLRTVRKYDPLRTQKPRLTPEQLKKTEESCRKLAVEGLAYEINGRFGISPLGSRVNERFKELRQLEILKFMAEADRPVSEGEIERHLHGICEQLFQQAIDEVKSR
jgi:transcriptional regulator with XRE-family HTH domain